MGLFTFVKDTGAKIFGMETSAEKAAGKEDQIRTFVQKFDLPVQNFGVKVADDIATISGVATNQPTKEKVVLAVGNIDGIGKVDDQMTVTEAAEAAKFYTVKGGDSLSKIAKEMYGDAQKYPQIFEANKPMLSHPDKIYPGQTLRIPS